MYLRDSQGRFASLRGIVGGFVLRCLLLAIPVWSFLFAVAYHLHNTIPAKTITVERVEYVKEARKVPDVLRRIAQCESGNRQYKDNGDVVRGKENASDLGRYQINERIHGDAMRRLGLNIYDADDNEQYALVLFDKYGSEPWAASRKCWGK